MTHIKEKVSWWWRIGTPGWKVRYRLWLIWRWAVGHLMLTRLRTAYIHWRFRRACRRAAKAIRQLGIICEETAATLTTPLSHASVKA